VTAPIRAGNHRRGVRGGNTMTDTGIGAGDAQGRPALHHRPGRYTDDISRRARPTPISCARRTPTPPSRRSTCRARRCPGVVAVFTGEDVKPDKHRRPDLRLDDPFQGRLADEGRPHPALAQGKVRYVGDHVAVVIAETSPGARRRRGVEVSYDVLPAVVDTGAKARRQAPAGPRRGARTTRSSTGRSATRPRPMPPSPGPRTSPSSTSSTTA
jgi:aerobic carbon-monoxide dehydrogenase large subunit